MFVQTSEETKRLTDAGLATADDMFFVATVQRGTVTMTVNVAVGRDYPTSTPSLALSIQCAGLMHTALNDEAVRVSHTRLLLCTVASLGLLSPAMATEGVTRFFPAKN